jgi:heme O synthase-like polyprenyltransferase
VQPQELLEAYEEDVDELSECPDHRPSSFERGKPRSIFSPGLQLLINSLLYLMHYVQELSATVAALYLVYFCYTISLLPWYPQSSKCLAGLDR